MRKVIEWLVCPPESVYKVTFVISAIFLATVFLIGLLSEA